jgi:hypothetical protein
VVGIGIAGGVDTATGTVFVIDTGCPPCTEGKSCVCGAVAQPAKVAKMVKTLIATIAVIGFKM